MDGEGPGPQIFWPKTAPILLSGAGWSCLSRRTGLDLPVTV